MAALSRILVPVEFSPRCSGAVQYAETLACHFGAEIVLLHVAISPTLPYGSPELLAYSSESDLAAAQVEERTAMLEGFQAEELKDLPVTRVVLQGDPARVIVNYAHENRCDLIVMPTHGYGPFRRFLLGSVTGKVLHDASCPVWTGPHMEQAPAHDSIHFRKILCALDFGPQSRLVLCWAAGFAREFGASLGIVHAIPASTVRLGSFYFDPEWRMHMLKTARERIDFLKDDLHLEAEAILETGDVADAVSQAARQWQADALVIGRGHAAGMLGGLRTHAYAILRESPCPVAAI
jgi:nucleotide-binding universal stress UspA family protein